MLTTPVIGALKRALGNRQVAPDQLMIYPDQGSNYRATDYRDLLVRNKLVFSMSPKAC